MANICLIGFMGSGKTTVGMCLAQKLQKPWIDLDDYIIEKAGKPIAQIFKEEGEQAFRTLEGRCLEEVLHAEESVISTGGGIVLSHENRERLQGESTVFLDYPFESLYERIKGDQARPLVTTFEALHNRYQERQPLYQAASKFCILCEGKSINDLVEEIIKKLNEI